jgi:hypothetical protein
MVRSGVGLLLVVAASASWVQIEKPAPWAAGRNEPDWVTSNEHRFDELKKSLPPSGVVGYLSDLDLGGNEGSAAWYTAEYSLVPLRLSPECDCESVIGNFTDSSVAPVVAKSRGLAIVRDFGRGVVLLRRSGK